MFHVFISFRKITLHQTKNNTIITVRVRPKTQASLPPPPYPWSLVTTKAITPPESHHLSQASQPNPSHTPPPPPKKKNTKKNIT